MTCGFMIFFSYLLLNCLNIEEFLFVRIFFIYGFWSKQHWYWVIKFCNYHHISSICSQNSSISRILANVSFAEGNIPPNHRTSKVWKIVVICFHFCFIVFHEAYTNEWLHAFEGINLFIYRMWIFFLHYGREQISSVCCFKGKRHQQCANFHFWDWCWFQYD